MSSPQPSEILLRVVEPDGQEASATTCIIEPHESFCVATVTYSGSAKRVVLRASSTNGLMLPPSSDVTLWVRDQAVGEITMPNVSLVRQTDPLAVSVAVQGRDTVEVPTDGIVTVTLGSSFCEFAKPKTGCELTPNNWGIHDVYAFFNGNDTLHDNQRSFPVANWRGFVASGCFVDLDGNGQLEASTDGRLAVGYLNGLRGPDLVRGVRDLQGNPLSPGGVELRMRRMVEAGLLDVDLDGRTSAETDGLLLLRALLGFRGLALVEGAIHSGSTRVDADEILNDLRTRCALPGQ